MPADTSVTRLVRVTNRCRVVLDTNRYSVPSLYASQRLTLKAFADRLCLYHAHNLVASHPRCYERHRDFENPDHVKELLDQRRRARDAKWLLTFYALSPQAEYYHQQLTARSLQGPRPHQQDRRPDRHLRPRKSRPRHGRRHREPGVLQPIHRKHPPTARTPHPAHPAPSTSPAAPTCSKSNSPPPTSPSTTTPNTTQHENRSHTLLDSHLDTLRLPFLKEHCQPLAATAAKNSLTHLDYLAQLIEGEAALRADRAVARRIQAARFPVIKTLDSFRWDWPKKINRLQIQDLFRLQFVHDKANVIFLGIVGLGKTHLATALGYAACQQGISVLFANAIDVINTLTPPRPKAPSKPSCANTPTPSLLILDEVGYLPIDQRGADLLFQVISARYERGSIVLTTNKAFKQWPAIFNGDSTITSAVLDRLLHHGQTVVIEGSSYRMKDRIEN